MKVQERVSKEAFLVGAEAAIGLLDAQLIDPEAHKFLVTTAEADESRGFVGPSQIRKHMDIRFGRGWWKPMARFEFVQPTVERRLARGMATMRQSHTPRHWIAVRRFSR